VAGRAFTAADRADAPSVMIINERLARQYFPDGNALGSQLSMDGGKTGNEIVGIVADVKQYELSAQAPYQIYCSFDQATFPTMALTLRTDAAPALLGPASRARIAAIDPEQPVGTMRSLAAVLSSSVARQRFAVALLGAFAIVALLMAVIGIYGVISDAVT